MHNDTLFYIVLSISMIDVDVLVIQLLLYQFYTDHVMIIPLINHCIYDYYTHDTCCIIRVILISLSRS